MGVCLLPSRNDKCKCIFRIEYMVRVSRFSLLLAVFSFLTAFTALYAQGGADDVKHKFAPINTAIPSLSIAPDARGGAMGDNGVATTPDVNSQYWNPAKYAFSYSKAGVALSYTPWLRKLVNDVALAYLAGYYKLGDSDMQAIGASLRYFSLGEVQESGDGGMGNQLILNPYEMAFDVSYSRKLSDVFLWQSPCAIFVRTWVPRRMRIWFRITLLPPISPVIWRNT